MLRFSLQNLILVVSFFGLVFAWFCAEDSRRSHRRISSVSVRNHEQMAVVCLLQSFQWPQDGKQLAVSRGNQNSFFDTGKLFNGYKASMLDELKAAGSITVVREPDRRIHLENEVTSFDCCDFGVCIVLIADLQPLQRHQNQRKDENV